MLNNFKQQIQKLCKHINIKNILLFISFLILLYFAFKLIFKGYDNICLAYIGQSEKAGQIGDSAGLLNSIFSGLALLGVIITVYLQSKELKQTTTELKNQKEEFQIQNRTLKRQQFENTFFNMLKTQEEIIYNLESGIEKYDSYRAGRRVFEKKYKSVAIKNKNYTSLYTSLKGIKTEDIAEQNYNLIKDIKLPNISLSKQICDIIGESFWNIDDIEILSHYFTFMYRIIKFVDDTDFGEFVKFSEEELNNEDRKKKRIHEEKSKYIDILRATLSTYELLMLFYNAINQNGMKDFIIRYELFNNISHGLLKENIYLYKLYVSKNENNEIVSAYGDRLKEIEENASTIYDTAMKNSIKENCSHKK